MERLDIFEILTLAGLAFSDQQSAFSFQPSACRLLPTAYCLLPASSLLGGWQGEGYLPRSFYRAGALGTDNIIPYELTMSSKKFCP
jgi:hypothetical protein